MTARRLARSPDTHDRLDLGHAEPDPSGFEDEREQRQCLRRVETVSRGRPPGRRQESRSLVEPKRFPGCPGLARQITHEQSVMCHTWEHRGWPQGPGQPRYPPDRVRAASARRKKLPSVTTLSPSLSPSRTGTNSPAGGPSFTARSTNLPSSPSAGTQTTERSPIICTAE